MQGNQWRPTLRATVSLMEFLPIAVDTARQFYLALLTITYRLPKLRSLSVVTIVQPVPTGNTRSPARY
jgi:hypothetical protein